MGMFNPLALLEGIRKKFDDKKREVVTSRLLPGTVDEDGLTGANRALWSGGTSPWENNIKSTGPSFIDQIPEMLSRQARRAGINDNDQELVRTMANMFSMGAGKVGTAADIASALFANPNDAPTGPSEAGPVFRTKAGPTKHLAETANWLQNFIVNQLKPTPGMDSKTAKAFTNDIMANASLELFNRRHPDAKKYVDLAHDPRDTFGYNGYQANPGSWDPSGQYQFDTPTVVLNTLGSHKAPMQALNQQAGTPHHEFIHWLRSEDTGKDWALRGKQDRKAKGIGGLKDDILLNPLKIVGQEHEKMYITPKHSKKEEKELLDVWNSIHNRDKPKLTFDQMSDEQIQDYYDFEIQARKRRHDAYRGQSEEKAAQAGNRMGTKDFNTLKDFIWEQQTAHLPNLDLREATNANGPTLKLLTESGILTKAERELIKRRKLLTKPLQDYLDHEDLYFRLRDAGVGVGKLLHKNKEGKGWHYQVKTPDEAFVESISSKLMQEGVYNNLPSYTTPYKRKKP